MLGSFSKGNFYILELWDGSVSKHVTRGIPLAGVFSSTLQSNALLVSLKGTGCQLITCADDIAVVVTGKHLHVLSELLQNALSLANILSKECGLSVIPR